MQQSVLGPARRNERLRSPAPCIVDSVVGYNSSPLRNFAED
jgi:hypothetical protein